MYTVERIGDRVKINDHFFDFDSVHIYPHPNNANFVVISSTLDFRDGISINWTFCDLVNSEPSITASNRSEFIESIATKHFSSSYAPPK